jgi:undecaprenyl phosphate N,N'-diacetylbacillosamine 1-phosphate transferase
MSYVKFWKRIVDFSLALLILAITFPLLIISAIGIKISSIGPIVFRQRRVGLHGETFQILKLRTMRLNDMRNLAQTYNNDPEVFPFGRMLRRLKLDELPQVFNVLCGDMSIVGPRPCLPQTFEEMPEWARRRSLVRPGITGMAQVNGNVALTWEERWLFDIKYVESISFFTDIRLIIKTLAVVILGEERYRVKR